MKPMIDILIPVYNEEENVTPLVERINLALTSQNIPYHLIFVDDHSTDNTLKKLKQLQKKYSLTILSKSGKKGKAYSIIEAAREATADVVAMIDADLQYPPEVLPEMFEKVQDHGMVVAHRRTSHHSHYRKLLSNGFRFVFGKVLLGLTCDVQSGLKMFKREIIEHIDPSDVTPWTLDVPLLHTALELDYSIAEVDITFADRQYGESKIDVLKSTFEIGSRAVHFRLKQKQPLPIKPSDRLMTGSGMIHKRRKFITHTSLPSHHSAIHTFSHTQKLVIFGILSVIAIGVLLNWLITLKILVGILTVIYFTDVLFNLFLILRSLHTPPEITISDDQLKEITDADLPTYTVLCPLYKEAHIVPHFLEAIDKMDWPKDKLDVMLLLEEDDQETVQAAEKMDMPDYVRVVVVPDSQPKTKPKACNYGLNFAKGEYLVIYDAEDIPDPQQLKKAFLGFQQVPANVRCLQAKLNYHNPHQNLLTRFFTAEYSLWFDVILTGLQSIETTIPLGGTSNHFRTQDLMELKGWDPFNVTEDCDLGIRLFKQGYKTAIIDSITLEEANSNWRNWLRQRSRWIKGYMQTYLIHMRHPVQFVKEHGIHALMFQLTVGGKIAFMLINPFMWLLTISYFTLYQFAGPTIEALYPPAVFYMAVVSLLFGNFMFIYYYMIGVAKREHWSLMKFIFLVPFYWLMVSLAAGIALYQLIVKPHYWEKTIHGLHLKQAQVEEEIEEKTVQVLPQVAARTISVPFVTLPQKVVSRLKGVMKSKQLYVGGLLLVGASMVANVLNLLFNIYLGRTLSLEEFGILSLTASFFYLASIPFGALTTTINERIGFISGRFDQHRAIAFWQHLKKSTWTWGVGMSILWILATPIFMRYFQVSTPVPFLLFTPVWLIGLLAAVDRGFVAGELRFTLLAMVVGVEAVSKLLLAVAFVSTDLQHYVYAALPLSLILTYVPIRFFLNRRQQTLPAERNYRFRFPRRFMVASLLVGLSTMSFLSLDVVLVKHVLSPTDAGLYGLVSLVGKMIFFLGSLTVQFIVPIVSFGEGAKKDTTKAFWASLLLTAFASGLGVVALGVAGPLTLPFILGERILQVTDELLWYSIGVCAFSISRVFITYFLAKKQYSFATVSFLLSFVQIFALEFFGTSLMSVVNVMTMIGLLNFGFFSVMYVFRAQVFAVEANVLTFLDLAFKRFQSQPPHKDKLRILIFNWRDTRHVWSGGAETYLHEIAKVLVKKGHKVTVFCGNDGHAPRNEVIDGVQMVRRGGFLYSLFLGLLVLCPALPRQV